MEDSLNQKALFKAQAKALFYPGTSPPMIRSVRMNFQRSADLIGAGSFGVVFHARIKKVAFLRSQDLSVSRTGRQQSKTPEPTAAVVIENVVGRRRMPRSCSLLRTREEEDEPEMETEENLGKCLTLNCQTEFALKIMAVKRRESKELSILKRLNHKNIVKLHYFYFSNHETPDEDGNLVREMCLNMFFELLPTTLFDQLEEVGRFKESEALFVLREVLLGLEYLHSLDIVHRDIKPSNILINPKLRVAKICDFGSAKVLTANSGPWASYICSRFYRAPELILGSDCYDDSVDMWSMGCILAEMISGEILFRGEETSMDQLVEIICVLGQVSEYQLAEMNSVLPRLDDKILAPRLTCSTGHERLADRLQERMGEEEAAAMTEEMFDLICEMLRYIPYLRPTAGEILDRIAIA